MDLSIQPSFLDGLYIDEPDTPSTDVEQEDASINMETLPQLPYGTTAEKLDGATKEQARILLSKMDDRERIQTAVHLGGVVSAKWETEYLLSQRKYAEYHKLVYPDSDSGALARQMGGSFSLEHIEELQKTPNGRKDLKRLWARTQLDRLTTKLALEYQQYEADAIDSDTAILTANWRRLVEDAFGGTKARALNIGKDFLASGMEYLLTGFTGVVRAHTKDMQFDRTQMIEAHNHYVLQNAIRVKQRENPQREITEKDVINEVNFLSFADDEFPETETEAALRRFDQFLVEVKREFYRPEARTGSFIYDKGSRVAKGLGRMGASIALLAANRPVGIVAMFGANVEEMRHRILADGGDAESAERNSRLYGLVATSIEFSNIDRLLRLSGSAPSVKQYLWNAIGVSTIANIGEGMGQSIAGDVVLERDRSTRDEYGGLDIVSFLGDTFQHALEVGVDSLPEGMIAGGVMGRPIKTIRRHVESSRFHRVVDSGVKLLAKSPDIKAKPAEIRLIIDDIIKKNSAPEVGFINADDLANHFAGDYTGLHRALDDMGITSEQFLAARESGSQIKVSTAGIIQHIASMAGDVELQGLVRLEPDAPTLKAIGEENAAIQDLSTELKAIRDENRPLPEQFDRFRAELIEAGRDPDAAQQEAELNYALAIVESARQGMTPEEFFESKIGESIRGESVARVRREEELFSMIEDKEAKHQATTEITESHESKIKAFDSTNIIDFDDIRKRDQLYSVNDNGKADGDERRTSFNADTLKRYIGGDAYRSRRSPALNDLIAANIETAATANRTYPINSQTGKAFLSFVAGSKSLNNELNRTKGTFSDWRIKAIDDAINESDPVKRKTVVYSRVPHDFGHEYYGYTSASIDPIVPAMQITRTDTLWVEINLPPGAKFAYVPKIFEDMKISDVQGFPDKDDIMRTQEVILPRGSKFRKINERRYELLID